MWLVKRCFELHCGSPAPSEQRTARGIHRDTNTSLPWPPRSEETPSASGWVISWHPKLPPCGVPLRSPRGEMDHVAACCSRNGKHLRGCPSQWSPGFRRLQERRSSLLVLVLEESGVGGRREGWGVESSPCPALRAAWVIVPRWGLSTPVSFRSALRALHPHSWDAWRPRVHLLHPDSITCQTPSVSPGAETFSTHLPLHTHALRLSKY